MSLPSVNISSVILGTHAFVQKPSEKEDFINHFFHMRWFFYTHLFRLKVHTIKNELLAVITHSRKLISGSLEWPIHNAANMFSIKYWITQRDENKSIVGLICVIVCSTSYKHAASIQAIFRSAMIYSVRFHHLLFYVASELFYGNCINANRAQFIHAVCWRSELKSVLWFSAERLVRQEIE